MAWKNRLGKMQAKPDAAKGNYRPLPLAGGSEAFRPQSKTVGKKTGPSLRKV